MPAELDTLNTELWQAYVALQTPLHDFRNQFYYIGDQIGAENWDEAKTQLHAAGDLFIVVEQLIRDAVGLKGKSYYPLQWISDNWPDNGNGEVTMAAILQAMYQANFTELQEFIAYVDAYRGSLWNEWFNIQYHADLVRGFKR